MCTVEERETKYKGGEGKKKSIGAEEVQTGTNKDALFNSSILYEVIFIV